jgi:murein L,D-transpeptidase YafK
MWRSLRGGLGRTLPVLGLIVLIGAVAQVPAEPLVMADEIVVVKHERKLYLRRRGQTLKWFWIALGRRPVGRKIEIGDGRTPEGVYRIVGREARSDFYRALRLSYPNRADRERARRAGANPGGGIMIHAVPHGFEPTGPGERMIDWTDGCIAVTNADMDEIWTRVADGTRVEIRP